VEELVLLVLADVVADTQAPRRTAFPVLATGVVIGSLA
jgi:hypothetical protein